MAACRYSGVGEKEERETEKGGSRVPVTRQLTAEEGGDRDVLPEQLASEEGGDGEVVTGQLISKEGEVMPDATMPTTATTPVTMKLSVRAVPDQSVVAHVRLARKAKERGAKKQRVERAVRRTTASQRGVVEIELSVV
ncbi:unnamed protein product [Phytophthora fragariaefolia]|uniref:Unnamed protein product n=1 Tax=Phytophthora fragariaefolia TaxID=1490495 RepID=A0A9W6YGX6_9STRA|nr:unnamed protein product [Phytophthora fragariaefolia]